MQIEFVSQPPTGDEHTALAVLVYEGAPEAGPGAKDDPAPDNAALQASTLDSSTLADETVADGILADATLAGSQVAALIRRAMRSSRFKGARGGSLELVAPQGLSVSRLLLVGAGARETLDDMAVEQAAAKAYADLKGSGVTSLVLDFASLSPAQTARAALGVRLAAYRFDKYRTAEKPETASSIGRVQIISGDIDASQVADAEASALAQAMAFARDLVSEPANVLFPEEFARRAKRLETLGLQVEILGEKEMAALGMGALIAVGHGSARESQLVVMQWLGDEDRSRAPLAFVGKGVCFDSGGLSLKSAEGMEDMKWDMGGAAAVAGLMHVLAGRRAKVNAVGILGLVENMPDGKAMRPGDIVTSMSGQTIEVLNTDAEGRLVLADALWYCQQRFKPSLMVDLATLTGAIIVALGADYAGLFSNDDELADSLLAAARTESELLWRMPLPAKYEKQLESPAADMKNVGGRSAGAITSALFLQKFVNGVPWAHLDIASTAWKKPSTDPTIPEGATGFGVRLLNRLVADAYGG